MFVHRWHELIDLKEALVSIQRTFIFTFTDHRLKTSTRAEVSQVHAVSRKFRVKDICTAGEAEEC